MHTEDAFYSYSFDLIWARMKCLHWNEKQNEMERVFVCVRELVCGELAGEQASRQKANC